MDRQKIPARLFETCWLIVQDEMKSGVFSFVALNRAIQEGKRLSKYFGGHYGIQ
jgi:hypothetical protein